MQKITINSNDTLKNSDDIPFDISKNIEILNCLDNKISAGEKISKIAKIITSEEFKKYDNEIKSFYFEEIAKLNIKLGNLENSSNNFLKAISLGKIENIPDFAYIELIKIILENKNIILRNLNIRNFFENKNGVVLPYLENLINDLQKIILGFDIITQKNDENEFEAIYSLEKKENELSNKISSPKEIIEFLIYFKNTKNNFGKNSLINFYEFNFNERKKGHKTEYIEYGKYIEEFLENIFIILEAFIKNNNKKDFSNLMNFLLSSLENSDNNNRNKIFNFINNLLKNNLDIFYFETIKFNFLNNIKYIKVNNFEIIGDIFFNLKEYKKAFDIYFIHIKDNKILNKKIINFLEIALSKEVENREELLILYTEIQKNNNYILDKNTYFDLSNMKVDKNLYYYFSKSIDEINGK